MPQRERLGRAVLVAGSLAVATGLALKFSRPGEFLYRGLYGGAQAAVTEPGKKKGPYALSKAIVVQRTLELISDEYVDPKRVDPRNLLVASLNAVQRDIAQVLVSQEDGGKTVRVRADDKEIKLDISDVKGPWDVLRHVRTVFTFLETNLKDAPEIDLREVEYAACNGMLRTLDPHSVLFSPEAFRDFNVTTSGKFGGLGIVISIRDKTLTIMSTMPGTPAGKSGLQRFDRIIQINGESTTTMGINEAVQRLRGDPDTDVTLVIRRDGKDGFASKPYKLTREEIHVSSVESKGLDDGIGYIRLKQFAETTAPDMLTAMRELKATGHDKGLVLDLRGNPGGLLDQAKKVVDAFVKEGAIVVSEGRKEGREELTAKDDHNEPTYPIAVLINSGSASASEIVAGALKNLDRAVIIGETSFGKGSVQKVERNIPPEGAALKITIAQYLTPGDISIQSVGIPPDVELDPMTADLQELDLDADAPLLRERDLSAHLSNAKAKEGGRPLEVLKYALSREDRAALRERGGDPDDQFALDFQINFARRFLKAAGPTFDKRAELVKRAKPMIDTVRVEEIKKVSDELAKIGGVDWSDAADPKEVAAGFDASKIKVTVEPSKPSAEVTAGEPLELKITVQNDGTVPLYRLRAQTKSDAAIFDGKELVFGKIEPGKSRTWTTPLGYCETEGSKPGSSTPAPKDAPRVCRIPRDTVTRADAVKIKFEEAHEHVPMQAELRTTVKALPRPSFAYAYQVADDLEGNHDGLLQLGEKASLYVTVKNVGDGKSYETEAAVKNLSGDWLFLRDARFDLSNMAPGEERRIRFTFNVPASLAAPPGGSAPPPPNEVKLQLSVRDADLRESASERIVMPIESPLAVATATGVFRPNGAAVSIFTTPRDGDKPFGELPPTGALAVNGSYGDWLRVELGGARFAFVKKATGKLAGGTLPPPPKPAASAKPGEAAAPWQAWADLLAHSPPSISVETPELVTRGDKIKLKGFAQDGDRVLDVYAFVGARKVYYRSNRTGADTKKASFEMELPLRPGVNYVSVWARETSDSVQRRVFVVRRDGAGGELLETPKGDDELYDLLGSGGGGE
jgi:carboxyl-terminal processing protease